MGVYKVIEMAKEGDEEAVLDVISKFKRTINKLNKKLGYEEAETDLTIALLIIVRGLNLNRFEAEDEGAIINYIYRSLINEYADLYKKKKKSLENNYI